MTWEVTEGSSLRPIVSARMLATITAHHHRPPAAHRRRSSVARRHCPSPLLLPSPPIPARLVLLLSCCGVRRIASRAQSVQSGFSTDFSSVFSRSPLTSLTLAAAHHRRRSPSPPGASLLPPSCYSPSRCHHSFAVQSPIVTAGLQPVVTARHCEPVTSLPPVPSPPA